MSTFHWNASSTADTASNYLKTDEIKFKMPKLEEAARALKKMPKEEEEQTEFMFDIKELDI